MTGRSSTTASTGSDGRLVPTSVQVRRLHVGTRALVAKSAVGRARQDLRHEAELLQHLAGPDVVGFVALRDTDERTDLVTEDAGAHDLASIHGIRPDELLVALQRTATAVARLHERGWTHGALCASHVVPTHHGVALCSLGSARRLEAEPSSLVHDRQQLVDLVHGVLDRSDPAWDLHERRRWRRIGRSVRRATSALHDGGVVDPPAATDLAAALDVLCRSSGKDVASTRRPSRPGPHLLSRSSVRLVAGMVGLAAVAVAWDALSGAPPSAAELETAGPERPVAAPTWSVRGNRLTIDGTTYRVGTDGDVLTVAPLSCGATPSVVLLRPGTGEVFRFDDRPTAGRAVAATHVTTAAGATGLATSDDPGCPRAAVVAADGAVHPVEVTGAEPTPEDPP
jgi:hypothetical protein